MLAYSGVWEDGTAKLSALCGEAVRDRVCVVGCKTSKSAEINFWSLAQKVSEAARQSEDLLGRANIRAKSQLSQSAKR